MQNAAFMDTVSQEVIRAVADMGFEEPTPIQALAIPEILSGRDVVGRAQTGTGKTAAFGIPLVEAVDASDRRLQALVLCPTRELAIQVAGEIAKLARYKPSLRVLPVYGGQPIDRQLGALSRGVQVVVGTPGRVMDHMQRGSMDLANLRLVVLDEADEMLDMGFRDDIQDILDKTPSERQTLLFSATMPRPILMLAQRYLRSPRIVEVAKQQMTVSAIEQVYVEVRPGHKVETLTRFLDKYGYKLSLVFCNTKRGVDEVVSQLQLRGYSAAGLHGDMRQIERDVIMAKFRQGRVKLLVATDVAARGLDIDDIEAVFNYDLPQDVEYYVHRIGRTGRAGKTGKSYTFVVGHEISRMWEYRRATQAKILCERAPSLEETRSVKLGQLCEQLGESASQPETATYLPWAEKMIADMGAEQALAAMLRKLTETEAPPESVQAPTVTRSSFYGAPMRTHGSGASARGGSVRRSPAPGMRAKTGKPSPV